MDKTQDKTPIRLTALLTMLFALTTFAYVYFTNYQPKILKKIEEVKGIKSSSSIELLYPENAEIISFSQTTNGSQTSYKISKPETYMQMFYKNLFLSMGWEEESIRKFEGSLIYKFKMTGKRATIIMQENEGITLVSLEVSKK